MNTTTTQILRHLLILKAEAQRPPKSTIKFIEDFREALSAGTLEIKEGIGNWIKLDINDRRTWPGDGEGVIAYRAITSDSYAAEVTVDERGFQFYFEGSNNQLKGVTHWAPWPIPPTN